MGLSQTTQATLKSSLPWLFLATLGLSQYTSELAWSLYVPAMLLVAVLFSSLRSERAYQLSVRHPEVWAPGLALLAILSVSVFWSPDPYISLIETLSYVVLFAAIPAVAGKPLEDIRPLPIVAGCVMIPFVIQGIYQAIVGRVNAHGWFHDSNLYAGYLTAGAAAVLAFAVPELEKKRRTHSIVLLALGAFLVSGAFMGHSRGAWLGLLVALAFTLCATKRHTGIRYRTMLATLAVISLTALASTTPKTQHDIAQHDGYGQSTNSRLAMWRSTAHMIEDHPVKGIGFGLWHLAYPHYRTADDSDSAGYHAHNDYLEAWASGGLPGAFAVFSIPLLWCVALLRGRKAELMDPWAFVGVSVASGVLVLQAMVNFIYHDLSTTLLVGVMLGAMFAHTRQGGPIKRTTRLEKAAYVTGTLTVVVWTLGTYLCMVPTIILGNPHGFEGKYLSRLMEPRSLEFLSRLNPIAPDPAFVIAQEALLDGLIEKAPAKKASSFRRSKAYFLNAEQKQGVQAGTSYKLAMLALLNTDASAHSRNLETEAYLRESLAVNPAYWPSVNAYARLMAHEGNPLKATDVISRATQAVPIYQRRQYAMLKSQLISGQLASGQWP